MAPDLFGTAGIRGRADEQVTPELALAVGRAAGHHAREAARPETDSDVRPEFVLARDGRVTGPALLAAVEAGLASAGVPVVRAGVLPTPALASASRGRRGVVITASHNPPPDNGIKLFADGTQYGERAERAVADRIDRAAGEDRGVVGPAPAAWDEWTEAGRIAPLPDYLASVAEYARGHGAPLDGRRIAVDCGNGAASLATPQVLERLGAEVVALNANLDGRFPGRESKPTPASLSDLRAFVGDDGAALGIGHDGDADRVVIVDGDGEVVHEDTVVAILAGHYVERADAADPVVLTTPNASGRIDERVTAAGGRVERVPLGGLHEAIADRRAAGDDVVFAAEPWKHVHPGLGDWIDGVASAAVLARLVADAGLDALRAPVTERPYRKANVECPDDRKGAAMALLTDRLPAAFPDAEATTEYGVRLDRPDGSWTLVRPSGTEPFVRVYAESEDADALLDRVTDVVAAAVADAGQRDTG